MKVQRGSDSWWVATGIAALAAFAFALTVDGARTRDEPAAQHAAAKRASPTASIRPDVRSTESTPVKTTGSWSADPSHRILGAVAGPVAACCVSEGCSLTEESTCSESGGYWNADVTSCGANPFCLDPDSDNPCCTGSCCFAGGQCEDESPGGSPMDIGTCITLGGTYIGGPLCNAVPRPCPVCEIAAGMINCQEPDPHAADLAVMSDRAMAPDGVVAADDFVPQGPWIAVVCVWGTYLDALECAAETEDCDCNNRVTDDFRVRVYADAGDIPGAIVGESSVTAYLEGPIDTSNFGGPDGYVGSQAYEYQLLLDTRILEMTAGERYWLEVSNNTVEDEDCHWHWLLTSAVGNGFHMVGTNNSPGYVNGMGRAGDAGDLSFCLDVALDAPPAVEGGCCQCPTDGGTCAPSELATCDGRWERTNDDCGTTCDTLVPGDDCATDAIVVTGNPDYTYTFDTTCTTTDGPVEEESERGTIPIGADSWFHYIVPCTGQVTVSLCGTGNTDNAYNSAVAVYHDGSDPGNCVCPGDPAFTRMGLAQDESCNGIADGSGGIVCLPQLNAGDCLTVRVAGYDADFGRGTVKISCEESECAIAQQPVTDPQVPDAGHGTRNRYLSFKTGSDGLNYGVRVTFTSLPPPYAEYEGDQWWVGEPSAVTEASGSAGSAPPPTFWAATLQCGTPYYTDWTQYDVLHVFDGGIVPGGVYQIQAISDDCNPASEASYSQPLTVNTSVCGDIVGDCAPTPCTPPDGVCDFIDITAVVDKFKNVPGAAQKARADILGDGPNDPPPNRKVDFIDISRAVNCFVPPVPPLPGPQQHCP